MTRWSWVALQGMSYSFIELHKPLHHNKTVIHEGVIHCDSPVILCMTRLREHVIYLVDTKILSHPLRYISPTYLS